MTKNNFKKILEIAKKIRKQNTIVIVAPYFNEERLKDGYYKRIKAIDDILKDYYRIYISYEAYKGYLQFDEYEDRNTTVIKYIENSKKHRLLVFFIMMLVGKIYCHSIWQVKKWFFKIPFVKVFVDVHGVVPEEETLYERYLEAQIYGDIEEIAVQKAHTLICVTNKIKEHLQKKYSEKFKAKTIILPIYDSSLEKENIKVPRNKKFINNKPIVIYAGSIVKWQKIELMQESINHTIDQANFMIYCPYPKEFWETWKFKKYKNLEVGSKSYKDLCRDVYVKAHYGYVLRDDITVNNVACPTKIADYFTYRIIPIVLTPKIGDFIDLGMKYITLEDYNNGKLLTKKELEEIADNNEEVLRKYIKIHEQGKENLIKLMGANK